MDNQAEYIKRIEIDGLWGKVNIAWNLRPDVNVLSGINGIGKSTIINIAVDRLFKMNGRLNTDAVNGVRFVFEPENVTSLKFDVIRSFDRPLLASDVLAKLSDDTVKTELDLQLYKLQRHYLDYQVNIANQMIDLLSSNNEEDKLRAAMVSQPKRVFLNMVDELFHDTCKKIDRRCNEIRFTQGKQIIYPFQLSSGEKQLLVILLTVLIQEQRPCVLFMDEPEVSLHIEWQQRLIGLIRKLNEHVQIILTTHSPAVIMDGWLDAVTEVSDISEQLK